MFEATYDVTTSLMFSARDFIVNISHFSYQKTHRDTDKCKISGHLMLLAFCLGAFDLGVLRRVVS